MKYVISMTLRINTFIKPVIRNPPISSLKGISCLFGKAVFVPFLAFMILSPNSYSQTSSINQELIQAFEPAIDTDEWFRDWSYIGGFYSIENREGLKVYHASDRNRTNPIPGADRGWKAKVSGNFYSVENRDGLKVYHASDRNRTNPIPVSGRGWKAKVSGDFYSIENREGLKVYHASDRNRTNPVPGADGGWKARITYNLPD